MHDDRAVAREPFDDSRRFAERVVRHRDDDDVGVRERGRVVVAVKLGDDLVPGALQRARERAADAPGSEDGDRVRARGRNWDGRGMFGRERPRSCVQENLRSGPGGYRSVGEIIRAPGTVGPRRTG
jgi:hypothetical protein